MKSAETERTHRCRLFDAICVAILIAYFLPFALPALRGGFREDEMMNMGICWQAGAMKSLLANIEFWKVFHIPGAALYDLPLYLYRPGGAVYYLPLYHFFDLDPVPYRIVQISILACVHSTGLLLEPATRLVALDRFSRCPCSVLPPAACRPRVCWCVHL
jgi:hypothetical protein